MDTETRLLELEAKLFAHRQLIKVLIRQFAAQQKEPEKFWATFDDCMIVQDYEEDPGVEPTIAYASNSITAFELRCLVEDAKP
jgi:hypothetical protein